jgi:hypothetical protein
VSVALLLAGLMLGFMMGGAGGFALSKALVARRKRGAALLVGVDPELGTVETRWVKPSKGGNLYWQRGEEKAPIIVGEGTQYSTTDEGRRAFLVNTRNLQTYRATPAALDVAADDGYNLHLYSLGIHERNVARSAGLSWLDNLVRYTPILVFGVIIILLGGFAVLASMMGGKGAPA